MVEDRFKSRFPAAIVAKYLAEPLPAQESGHAASKYIGPAIKTTVRALGVQHFAVYAEPESKRLAEFKSANGPEAFDTAVENAEGRGLPWRVSGGADVFDPATGRRWSYHIPPARSGNPVLVKRWRGGTASEKGFTEVGARIELAKRQKAEPNLEWRMAAQPYLDGRFELQAFETKSAQEIA